MVKLVTIAYYYYYYYCITILILNFRSLHMDKDLNKTNIAKI